MIIPTPPPKKNPVPVLVRVRDVASILSLSRHTVHTLIETGDLTGSDVGPSPALKRRHLRVTRGSLYRFYKRRFGHSLNAALANPFET